MGKIIYQEMSYKLIGCIYEMYNQVGFGYQEKHYQRILAEILKQVGLKFQKEVSGRIIFNGRIIARYYLDFLVEDRIIVELKVVNDFYTQHRNQVLTYLKAHNLKLGILVLITKDGIKYERLLNSQYSQ